MESIQLPEMHWLEGGHEHRAGWRSEAGVAPHGEIGIVDDRSSADDTYRQLESGMALLWRGDWVNARHLMQALTKRAARRFGAQRGKAPKTPAEAFARHRETQGKRAALLNRLLVPLAGDYSVPLRRAQDVGEACR
ncbi:MAG: hypothetical protein JNL09_10890, partial [Anaerolineales bacterium]|nr:hypothetical protein [Anaerolineales bacterium]